MRALFPLVMTLAAACAASPTDPEVEVSIPSDEPASTGSWTARVVYPDGHIERVAGERDGSIAGSWIEDLNGDGSLELVVWCRSAGSGSYGEVQIHRLSDDGNAPLGITPLAESQRVGYMGHDVFDVVDGVLWRSFPLYANGDANASPTGGSRRLRYDFDAHRWIEG